MFAVVTGGSASGKSAYAEELITNLRRSETLAERPMYYVATMYAYDGESQKRIARHRAMRAGKGFETIEQPLHLDQIALEEGSLVLLECMSNLAANEMYMEEGAGKNTVSSIMKGIYLLKERCSHLVVVTNEVFSDGAQYDESTERYLQCLGVINQEMGQAADQVTEVVYGIQLTRKQTNEGRTCKNE